MGWKVKEQGEWWEVCVGIIGLGLVRGKMVKKNSFNGFYKFLPFYDWQYIWSSCSTFSIQRTSQYSSTTDFKKSGHSHTYDCITWFRTLFKSLKNWGEKVWN